MKYDCVVVGSGAAGLTCAVVAAQRGLSVLVVEKAERFGGTSARSGGVAWIPCNPYIPKNTPDSPEQAMAYLAALVGTEHFRPDLLEAYCAEGPHLVTFLEEHSEVRFSPVPVPDYRQESPGALPMGRSLIAVPYEARQLGNWIERLERPYPDMCLLGGMMVDGLDLFHLMNITRSFASLRHATKRFFRYLFDYATYQRGMRLTAGNALMGRLLRSAVDSGVTLWTEARVTRILSEGGLVTGVVVERDGAEVAVEATRGVVLATGGFARDQQLAETYLPAPVRGETRCAPGATGDGLRLGLSAGARMGPPLWQDFLGNQVYKRFDRFGRVVEETFHTRRDRNKPGFVLLDRHGKRFANEAISYHELTRIMVEDEDRCPSHLICDHVRLRKYGLGLLRPGPAWARPLRKYLKSGHIVRANSIESLADAIGANPAVLSETVRRNNVHASSGKDPDFGKGDSAFDRWQGDPMSVPNPNLGPIETGPFYAVKVYPSNFGTFRGLDTDAGARVLDIDGAPVPGLYACGCDMQHIMSGHYASGGSVIGPAMTFGFIAATQLAL